LIAKRQEGVVVNMIYDSFGSSSTPAAFFDRLKRAGVTVVAFNPMNPLETRVPYAPNDRDHRKILIVDGTTAIIGGVNLSTTYQSSPLGKSGAPPGAADEYWRDTDLQLDGPVVAQLQTLFFAHWASQKGPPIPAPSISRPSRRRATRSCASSPARPTAPSRATTSPCCRRSATPRKASTRVRPISCRRIRRWRL